MANIESTWLGSWSRCRDVRDNHTRAVAAVKLAAVLSPRWLNENNLSSSTEPNLRHWTHCCAISDLQHPPLPRLRISPLSGFTACLAVCPGRSWWSSIYPDHHTSPRPNAETLRGLRRGVSIN
jgi:hypothetical protein